MVDRKWHEQLHRELVRQGLPRPYSERLMDELLDHAISLQEETVGMDAVKTKTEHAETVAQRIGAPEQLAQAAGEEYRKRTWWGRHPIMTFIVAPIPVLVLSFLLCGLLLLLPIKLIEMINGGAVRLTTSSVSPVGLFFMQAGYFLWAIAPFIVTSCLACWISRRTGRGPRWLFAACAAITLVAAAYQSHMVLPTAPGNGALSVGFGFPIWRSTAVAVGAERILLSTGQYPFGHLFVAVLPLAICAIFVWRNSRQNRMPPSMPTYSAQISVSN